MKPEKVSVKWVSFTPHGHVCCYSMVCLKKGNKSPIYVFSTGKGESPCQPVRPYHVKQQRLLSHQGGLVSSLAAAASVKLAWLPIWGWCSQRGRRAWLPDCSR